MSTVIIYFFLSSFFVSSFAGKHGFYKEINHAVHKKGTTTDTRLHQDRKGEWSSSSLCCSVSE